MKNNEPSKTAPDRPVLTEEAFEERYKPRLNHFYPDAENEVPFGGCLYETYGQEWDHVKAQDPRHVWTVVSGEEDSLWYLPGFHLVNRLGYLVCEHPHAYDAEAELDTD
jgi:hypothetical protein